MSPPEKLRLHPRRWTHLPGTGFEAMLHGKMRAAAQEGMDLFRTGRPGCGGWDLAPAAQCCYVRRAPR